MEITLGHKYRWHATTKGICEETDLRGPHIISKETDLKGPPYSKRRN